MIGLHPVTAEDIETIAANPRPADLAEVGATSDMTFKQALQQGMDISSHALTVTVDGEPVAVFGVVPWSAITGMAAVWMLGSAALDGRVARRAVVKYGHHALAYLRDRYPGMLFNCVAASNTSAVRFLRWLGFTLKPAVPYGRRGELFHPFYIQGHADV